MTRRLLFVSFACSDALHMPTRTQKLTVVLAFVAAALSLTAAAIRFFADGAIDATPLLGGLFMLVLGIGGYRRLKQVRP